MTPAERYIASQYEVCVDRSLDVEAIRLHLAASGIPRSPAQIVHDLETVFCFIGYAASHPAPAVRSLKEIDATIR